MSYFIQNKMCQTLANVKFKKKKLSSRKKKFTKIYQYTTKTNTCINKQKHNTSHVEMCVLNLACKWTDIQHFVTYKEMLNTAI